MKLKVTKEGRGGIFLVEKETKRLEEMPNQNIGHLCEYIEDMALQVNIYTKVANEANGLGHDRLCVELIQTQNGEEKRKEIEVKPGVTSDFNGERIVK